MNKTIMNLLKNIYIHLPLKYKQKIALKNCFYRTFRFILKDTNMYKIWESSYTCNQNSNIKNNNSVHNDDNSNILPVYNYKRHVLNMFEMASEKSPEFVDYNESDCIILKEDDIKLIALYLPQFHQIPENDEWWGRGFTEWTNVTKATPQFIGHHQPQLPIDMGFYDLRNIDVIKRQIELARTHGIYGFCFHYYWFDGKRLLETPINNYINNKDIDFPFCLCWANENWTRRWDGLENEILIEQNHNSKSDIAFIEDISLYFNDKRYIRIENKPVLIIYRLKLLPNPVESINRWREYYRKTGKGELFIIGVKTFGEEIPKKYGVDAAMEFPPHGIEPLIEINDIEVLNPNFNGYIYSYPEIVKGQRYLFNNSIPTFKTVSPGWDNTARKPNSSTIFHGSSPMLYKEWLTNVIIFTKENFSKDKQYVFINAWNEWAEGAHLEPDRKYGYGYLKVTAEAILDSREFKNRLRTLNLTPDKNEQIYKLRWNRLFNIFNSEFNINEYSFLADYTKLFMLLVKTNNSVEFLVDDGVPSCIIDNNYIQIRTRNSITKVVKPLIEELSDDTITFVLLQYNKPGLTLSCINSIKALKDDRVRIIVVDNGSTEENKKYSNKMCQNDPIITLIFNDENLGFANGNNIGYNYARKVLKSRFVIVINNDTIINDSDFINKIEDTFKQWSFSILGPDIVINDGRQENPWNDYIYSLDDWKRLLELYKKEKQIYLNNDIAEFKKIGTVSADKEFILNPILQGAAYIVSPIFLADNENLFDERTFLYGEEFLVSVNALIKGELLLYSSNIKIMHNEASSTAQFSNNEKVLMGYDNAIYALELGIEILNDELNKSSNELTLILNDDVRNYISYKKVNILFDLFFCQPGYHGGGEYGKAVFKSLAENIFNMKNIELWVVANPNIFIDDWIWNLCKQNSIKIIPVKNYDDIINIVNDDYFDVFFTPALVVYTGYEYMKIIGKEMRIKSKKTKVIGAIHDIRDYEFALDSKKLIEHNIKLGCLPECTMSDVDIKKQIKMSQKQARDLKDMYINICESSSVDTIVTISEYSRKSLIENIGDYSSKIRVFFAPMKSRTNPQRFNKQNENYEDIEYALVVNAGRKEKNAIAVVKAFDSLFSDSTIKNLFVVLTGLNSIEELGISKLENPSRFILLGYIKPEHLEYLYKNAKFLVYMSLGEGFGYPPVEAMSYNVPSLLSNVSSIPEVCGEAGIYSNPYDVDSIKQGIIKIIETPIDLEVLKKRYNYITSKQKNDLHNLVRSIIDKANKTNIEK